MKKYITQDRMKKKTLADIFAFILEKKQTTRREIEYETNFSWGTVSSNVAYLPEKEYIVEEKSEKSGGVGRTTYILKPCADRFVSIGLDINRSGLSCEIVGFDYCVKKRFEKEFDASSQEEVLASAHILCDSAIEWIKENCLTPFCLGIAVQGSIDSKSGISCRFPEIPDWQPCNIKDVFSDKYSLPVYLGHDPKCMLLGEMCKSKGCDSILVRIDEGIGMAVSLDGKILDGTDKFELAHTVSEGHTGCLENYCSLRAIANAEGTDVKRILEHPENYSESLERAGALLSTALYNVYIIFKPQRIILTGSAASLDVLCESALSKLNRDALNVTVNPLISASYGAAIEAIRNAVKNLCV